MIRLCLSMLIALCCASAFAQQLPDINDAYVADRAADQLGLGPADAPGDPVDRYAMRLGRADRLDYEVRVTYASGSEVRGSVSVARGPAGRFDRFRFDGAGEVAGVGPVDLTLGSTGKGFYVVDRLRRTVSEVDDRDVSTPFGRLAHYVLVPELAIENARAIPGADAGEVALHLVDETLGEHVYCRFAEDAWLPRQVERVGPGPDGRPGVATIRIAEESPAGAPPSFELAMPDGFRRVASTLRRLGP